MRALKIEYKITRRDEASLDKYLRDISREKMLTADEEIIYAERITKHGDKQALDTLVRGNLRFVVSVAKQYQNLGVPLPDLISAGNIGLIRAAEKFDYTRGFKFISYAVWWIRQSINASIGEHKRIVRYPANAEDTIHEYNKTFAKLESKLGRQPTFEEIEDFLTEISEEKGKEIKRAKYTLVGGQGRHSFISEPLGSDAEGEAKTLEDTMINEDNEDIEYVVDEQFRYDHIMSALAQLSRIERQVVIWKFGLNGEEAKNYDEIGTNLNLTGERIRQIAKKSIRKLKSNSRTRKILEDCR